MAARRPVPVRRDLDPLYLRCSAKLLRVGVPHDDLAMVRRAGAQGLTAEEHRDAALGLAEGGSGGKGAPAETRKP